MAVDAGKEARRTEVREIEVRRQKSEVRMENGGSTRVHVIGVHAMRAHARFRIAW